MRTFVKLTSVLFGGFVVAHCAAATDVYVCNGAGGLTSYQNDPCPKASTQVGKGHYDEAMARPGVAPPQYTAPAPQYQQAERAAPRPSYNPPAPAPTAGFQCTAGSRVWIQVAPCPPTYASGSDAPVDGHTAGGEQLNGWVHFAQQLPVQQLVLDRDQFCDKVRSGVSLNVRGSDAAESYERNKIKRNDCGG